MCDKNLTNFETSQASVAPTQIKETAAAKEMSKAEVSRTKKEPNLRLFLKIKSRNSQTKYHKCGQIKLHLLQKILENIKIIWNCNLRSISAFYR